MTRLASFVAVTVVLVATMSSGCEKPTEDSCRKAIANMQQLMGTDNLRDHAAVESEVRRCKGGSSRKSVECAIKAQTLQELRSCDFYKVPENAKGIGTGEPSSVPGPGSAVPGGVAPGSAATGNAAPGGDPPGGAADGSAADGSAADGRAAAPGGAPDGSAADGSAAAPGRAPDGSAAPGSAAPGAP